MVPSNPGFNEDFKIYYPECRYVHVGGGEETNWEDRVIYPRTHLIVKLELEPMCLDSYYTMGQSEHVTLNKIWSLILSHEITDLI